MPRVMQLRNGTFSMEIFARYKRSKQTLVLSLIEMVVSGVSTHKVIRITEELYRRSFSKSTVRQLCRSLDNRDRAFKERPPGNGMSDATSR